MEVMRREGAIRRERLWAAVARVKEAFVVAGQPVPPGPGPVIPVAPPTPRAAVRLQRRLVAAGIHPPQIRYPGGPADRFFRFALSSEHDAQQVDTLRSVLVDYLGHDT
jgi:7-keto-8-aminopelargonate synthetase-like enzyme